MQNLSPAAVDLFRLHGERNGEIDVTDANRELYRELEDAGLMLLSRPFTGPRVYRMTKIGWKMTDVLARIDATAPSLAESASPHS